MSAMVVTACAGPAAQAPVAQVPVAPPPVVVDFEIVEWSADGAPRHESGDADACCATDARAIRAQPPEVKLKLGHYHNPSRGIGLVIDRTGDDAKVRFDGTDHTIRLVPRYFWHRTEYHRAKNDKVLEVRPNGQITVHVAGAGEGIRVYRDGDADPL